MVNIGRPQASIGRAGAQVAGLVGAGCQGFGDGVGSPLHRGCLSSRSGRCRFSSLGQPGTEKAGLDNPIVHDTDLAIKTAVEAVRHLIAQEKAQCPNVLGRHLTVPVQLGRGACNRLPTLFFHFSCQLGPSWGSCGYQTFLNTC